MLGTSPSNNNTPKDYNREESEDHIIYCSEIFVLPISNAILSIFD